MFSRGFRGQIDCEQSNFGDSNRVFLPAPQSLLPKLETTHSLGVKNKGECKCLSIGIMFIHFFGSLSLAIHFKYWDNKFPYPFIIIVKVQKRQPFNFRKSLTTQYIKNCPLLYRQECFSGKQTTCKVHMKLHQRLKWHIFHILTSGDIGDVISHFYTVVCAKILVYITKRKLHGGLKI